LQELRLVERHVPVTEAHPHKSRKGIYRLRDHFFRFWFRFVYPYESALARGDVASVLAREIEPHLDEFVSVVFEEVARQHIWRLAIAQQLPFAPRRVGEWWDKDHEIEVVAVGEDHLLVGECKWSSRPVGVSILNELNQASAALVAQGQRGRLHYALFSRAGFTEELKQLAHKEGVLLYEAADLVA
jgi:AAA+ ATPase superfamily predicted ATPase